MNLRNSLVYNISPSFGGARDETGLTKKTLYFPGSNDGTLGQSMLGY